MGSLPRVARPLAILVGVLASGQLTFALPTFGATVYPVWFPAAVMLFVLRLWPTPTTVVAVAVGGFLVNWQLSPWYTSVGIAAGATAGYYLAASLLRRSGFDGDLSGMTAARRFLVFGCLLAPAVSAVNGPLWLAASGTIRWSEMGGAVAVWWMGDAVGILTLAPALFAVGHRPPGSPAFRPTPISAAGILGTAAVSAAVFMPESPIGAGHLPVAFLPVLLLCWLSLLVRPAAAALALLAAVVAAVIGSGRDGGPFAPYSDPSTALLLGFYGGTVGVVTVLIVAARATQTRTAQALASAAREYQLLVDGSPTLICRYRADGRVTFANDTLRAFAGDDPDGERLDLPAGAAGEAEVECLAADGSRRWVRWTAQAVGPDEFQAVGVDVTARRKAEDERRAMEQQMFQTAKLESIGVITGGVAHDFNNILTAVLGNVELVSRALPTGSPLRVYLTKAADAASLAAGLNRQLLAYAGKGRFLIRSIDPNDLAARTVELVRLSLPKKVAVRVQLGPALPTVRGDESQLQQVLMNLLINAGDAIGDRPGTITLRTDQVDGAAVPTNPATGLPPIPGRYAAVTVSDTGSGMDAATVAKIFEPYFTTKPTGRGLGLAAVQGIVHGHGGALDLETAPGAGTTFTVYLPEHVPEPTDEPEPPADDPLVPEQLAPRPNAKRNTVLVVDDEDAVRELTATILGQLGWAVLTAANGREGVDVFRQSADRIACAVLDLTMPVMDGLEAMAELRGQRPRLPVLICTGFAEESIPPSTTNAPTGILLKPFRPDDLQRALSDLFQATTGGTSPLP